MRLLGLAIALLGLERDRPKEKHSCLKANDWSSNPKVEDGKGEEMSFPAFLGLISKGCYQERLYSVCLSLLYNLN